MNKTITIDLGKMAFIIEEGAYEKLNNYLKNIKNNLGANSDSEEIMTDIETAIAEKLLEKINPSKQVITSEDIDELIKIMGRAEDFGEQSSHQDSTATEEKSPRRLYRNPDDVIVAGVCSGIAAYFDIDPVIVRLLFVFTVIAGGSGILIYIILWLVMPEAKTPSQKLEMRGNQITIAAIKKTVESGMEQVKQIGKRDSIRKIIRFPFLVIEAIFNFLKKIFKVLIPIARIMLGLFVTLISLSGLIAASIFCCLLLTNAHTPYIINNIPIQEFIVLIPFQLLVITFYLMMILPLIFTIILGISLLRKKNMLSFLVGAGLIGVWTIALIIFLSLAIGNAPKIGDKINRYEPIQTSSTTLSYADFKNIEAGGYHLEISVEKGDHYLVTATGHKKDLDNLNTKLENDNLKIERNQIKPDNYCLFCNNNDWINVKIITPNIDSVINNGTDITLNNLAETDNIIVTTTDDGLTQIYGAVNNLKLNLTGNSKATLKAQIKNLIATISETSYLSAWSSKIEKAVLNMNNYSKAKINTNDLTADLKDEAKLYYLDVPKTNIIKTENAEAVGLTETKKHSNITATIIKNNETENNTDTFVVSESGKTIEKISDGTIEQVDDNIININGKNYKFTNVATDSIYIEKDNFDF